MKTSMFDPYKEKIQEFINLGYNIKEIREFFGEGYQYQALYEFVRRHNMKPSREIPKCSDCEYMKNYESVELKQRRICTRSWKEICKNVSFAPRWCEERKVI